MKKALLVLAVLFVGLGFAQEPVYRLESKGPGRVLAITDTVNNIPKRYPDINIFADINAVGNVEIFLVEKPKVYVPIEFNGQRGIPYTQFIDGDNADATFASAEAVTTWFDTNFKTASGGSGADQELSLDGTDLTISGAGGNTVDLSSIMDGSASLADTVELDNTTEGVTGAAVHTKFLEIGKNKIDKSLPISGYLYNTSTGVVTPSGTFYISGKQPVEPSTAYTATCYTKNLYNIMHFFDISGAWLGNSSTLGGGGYASYVFTFTTPANCYFVGFNAQAANFSDFNDFKNSLQLEKGLAPTPYEEPGFILQEELIPNDLLPENFSGLKTVLFGDSVSIVPNNWTGEFSTITGITDLTNMAVSGQKICWRAGTTETTSPPIDAHDNNVFWNSILKYQDLYPGSEPDAIIVALGTNDISQSSPLGTYADAFSQSEATTSQQTMAGAFRKAIHKLINDYPDAQIFYVTPIQSKTGGRSYTTLSNVSDINVEIAKKMNVKVIDALHNSGIYDEFEGVSVAGRYLTDGVHPSVAGSKIIGKCIAKEFKNGYYFGNE